MVPATPGVRKISEYTLRVFSGSSAMRRLSTSLASVDVVDSIGRAVCVDLDDFGERADFEREVDPRGFVERQRHTGARRRS